MSRFVGGNSFNPIILRDQIVSLARNAQQSSLGRSDVEFSITPNPAGDEVTLESSDTNGVIETVTISMNSVSLSGDVNETDSCDTTNGTDDITDTAPMTVVFEELGDLGVSGVTGSTAAVSSALRVCINNEPTMSVCISPSGFAYAGDCDA